jgi:hypothetical protein
MASGSKLIYRFGAVKCGVQNSSTTPMADFRNLASFLDKVNTREVAHLFSLVLHLGAKMWFLHTNKATAKYAEFQQLESALA